MRGAVEPKGLTSAARGIRPARARPPGRAQQAEPDPAGKRGDYPTRRALLHSAISPPEMAIPTRREAMQQASDARFVMVFQGPAEPALLLWAVTRTPFASMQQCPTDRAAAYPRVLDELVPAVCHITDQYRNNPIEADHGRLKSRLRPMRGLKQLCCARVISAGHAFIQNIRRGHYELGTEGTVTLRLRAAFDELALAI